MPLERVWDASQRGFGIPPDKQKPPANHLSADRFCGRFYGKGYPFPMLAVLLYSFPVNRVSSKNKPYVSRL